MTDLLFVLIDLPILEFLMVEYIICGLLCLVLVFFFQFTSCFQDWSHCSVNQYLYLVWSDNIAFYSYHIFIHLSDDGQLGRFYLLAFLNSLYVDIMFSFLLDVCLGSELLGDMVTLVSHLRNWQTIFQSGCTILLYFHWLYEVQNRTWKQKPNMT